MVEEEEEVTPKKSALKLKKSSSNIRATKLKSQSKANLDSSNPARPKLLPKNKAAAKPKSIPGGTTAINPARPKLLPGPKSKAAAAAA